MSNLAINNKSPGLTLIELIVALAVLAISITIAVPSLFGLVQRSEMRNAQNLTADTLRKAKTLARSHASGVTVSSQTGNSVLTMRFQDGSPDILVPLGKVNVQNGGAFVFSSIGTVDRTGDIVLESAKDPAATRTVRVANLLGHLQLQ